MADNFTHFTEKDLKAGTVLRAKKDVRGHVCNGQMLAGGKVVLGFDSGLIKAGEEVTFLVHDYGAGSDPAFQAVVRKANGIEVVIHCGWAHLRKDDFEAVKKE